MRLALIALNRTTSTAEIALAIQGADMEAFDFSWDMPVDSLSQFDGFVLFADTGALLSDPPLPALATFLQTQSSLGKPILGLAYAAAFLVDHGLVPGLYKHWVGLSVRKKTIPAEFQLRLSHDYQYNAFTRLLNLKDRWSSPLIAQLEFVIPPGLLSEIESQGLDVFRYCEGEQGIAALANKAGNVMAMLAYPESGPQEAAIYNSLREHAASGYVAEIDPLSYWPR